MPWSTNLPNLVCRPYKEFLHVSNSTSRQIGHRQAVFLQVVVVFEVILTRLSYFNLLEPRGALCPMTPDTGPCDHNNFDESLVGKRVITFVIMGAKIPNPAS